MGRGIRDELQSLILDPAFSMEAGGTGNSAGALQLILPPHPIPLLPFPDFWDEAEQSHPGVPAPFCVSHGILPNARGSQGPGFGEGKGMERGGPGVPGTLGIPRSTNPLPCLSPVPIPNPWFFHPKSPEFPSQIPGARIPNSQSSYPKSLVFPS